MKNKFLKYNNKSETLREKIWYNNLEPVYGWKTHLYNFEIHNEMGNIVQKDNMVTPLMWIQRVCD